METDEVRDFMSLSPSAARTIMLVDMNAYFASVEQQCNPALRGKPVAVCGEGRTVIVTASYEARAFGVKTGMTLPEARQICPGLIPVQGDLDKYIETSLRIHKILLDYTDMVEVFSIDECFMDVTATHRLFGGAVNIAREIKDRIKKEFGLLCSVGIGPNRVVSKIAGKMHKPDGLTVMNKEDIYGIFKNMPVEKLQGVGIGPRVAEKLYFIGIKTAAELGGAPVQLLKSHFGILGRIYKAIGMGLDDTPVAKYGDEKPVKSVGHSHTLAADTTDINVIYSYLLMLCEKTGFRLRGYKLTARTAAVYVRFSDFTGFSQRKTFKHYFDSGEEIFKCAKEIFDSLLPLQKEVRLLGISVGNLSAAAGQSFLFENDEKKRQLTCAVDEINKKHGDFTVKPALLITAEKFGILERCGIISTRIWKK
ncbi:MAG: DNA polymerase IV [Candidatus Goldiibacteriota bacterium HGW-Goldbacteria-1]|jgi:DNA polymerase-4|nr:MAG: DNA polymerase IV [Candidatus Goldiibacteriota bacterium HGW-Goldbacteria-1]